MSLKGKIEAIIYAAEEPVTLAQLLALLSGEAAAELDARAARQTALFAQPSTDSTDTPQPSTDNTTIPPPSEPDDLNSEVLEAPEPARTPTNDAPAPAQTPTNDAPEHPTPEIPNPEEPTPALTHTAPPAPASTTPATSAEPPDEKFLQQQARERERAIRDRDRAIRDLLREQLDSLVRDYRDGDRGLEIREVANGFRLATRPEYHDAVRGFARSLKPPLKLSLQALETLAVVAYKQPVTAPEVAEIRGVDSAGVLGSLAARKLVTTAGRKPVVGRPILYKTTKEFLLRFGLRDLAELPSIEEFERLANELADTEPHQEEISMPPRPDTITGTNLREEADATEPQADGSTASEVETGTPVDGRISGPPPIEEQPIDSPAGDAALQADQQAEYAAENGTED